MLYLVVWDPYLGLRGGTGLGLWRIAIIGIAMWVFGGVCGWLLWQIRD